MSPASGERWERRTDWRYSAFRRRSRETELGRGSWERGGNSVSKTDLPSRFVMIFRIRSHDKNWGNWFGCFVKDSQHKVHLVIWGGRRPADRREAGGGWHICQRYRLQVIQTTISPEESFIFPSLALPFFCSVVWLVWLVSSQPDLSPRKGMRGSSTPSSRREGRATPSTLSTPRITRTGSESESSQCSLQCQKWDWRSSCNILQAGSQSDHPSRAGRDWEDQKAQISATKTAEKIRPECLREGGRDGG